MALRRIFSFFLTCVMVLNICFINANAATATNPILSSVDYRLDGEQVVETIHIYENGELYSTIVRTVYPSGDMNVLLNGTRQETLSGANYVYYLSLVGISQVFRESDINALSQNSLSRTSNFGCGHNDKIHSYIGRTTQTYYNSEIAGWRSASAIATALVAKFAAPYTGLMVLADIILNAIEVNSPDKMVVTESNYDVLTVGDNSYLFSCHHFLVGEYTWTQNHYTNEFEYILSDSYDYYTQSIGG